jgi:hypothetical protein
LASAAGSAAGTARAKAAKLRINASFIMVDFENEREANEWLVLPRKVERSMRTGILIR